MTKSIKHPATTYRIVFKRGIPKEITLRDIVAVDYRNGHLYYSDSQTTYCFHADEVETSERVSL